MTRPFWYWVLIVSSAWGVALALIAHDWTEATAWASAATGWFGCAAADSIFRRLVEHAGEQS